jgi:hypothetical protein
MTGLFTVLLTPIRAMLALLTVMSVSVMGLRTIEGRQPPVDPFAPYAQILTAKTYETLARNGFRCEYKPVTPFDLECVLLPQSGPFFRVDASIARATGQVSRVVFTPRDRALRFGDLGLLWGRPEIVVRAQVVNFRWRGGSIIAIPQAGEGDFSYQLPLSSVAFVFSD